MDYLGGHGTRGSGRVKISDLTLKAVDDTVSNDLLNEVEAILKGVM